MRIMTKRLSLALSPVLFLPACNLLEVTNPGPINDSALDDIAAVPGLVVGMSADLSLALRRTSWEFSVMGDELSHSGTHSEPTAYARGQIPPVEVNPFWGEAHRARWVAENGIQRMKKTLGAAGEQSNHMARAYVLAGFANRMLGEHVCWAVIDGGPAESHVVHFERAESHFTAALAIAGRTGNQVLGTAARAGRASVRLALGNWAGAVEDAQQVPVAFRYDAIFSTNSARETNLWPQRNQTRGEYTVWGSQWMAHGGDPRVPRAAVLTAAGDTALAANGRSLWVRQRKFIDHGDNIALAKGTEMLLVRAEAALRQQDVASAMAYINQGRAFVGLNPLTASSLAEAWPLLHTERGAVLWLEGRRMGDLRRWYQESGPAHHGFLEGRDKCVPISANEVAANRNIS
jgi:starch-binding outer membrane protein, SusD/RagB family